MTLSNSNIFSESFTLLKSFLNGISGIDPRGRYKANLIHASMPNVNSKGFDGYPFIIIKCDPSDENKSFNPAVSEKVFRVLLRIYSDEATEVDSISDKIFCNLKDETKLTDFKAKEMSTSPIDWDLDMNGKKIIFRSIGLILRVRI